MKIKKMIASLLSVAVIGISMPVFLSDSEIFVTASTNETYGDFQIKKYDDHVEISKYTGKSAEVAIPSKIDGLPVTSIGDEAFISCYSIESIIIPDSVTSICTEAFSNCRYLTSITIPDSVTSIGDSAFVSCTKLESIIIPDSVTSIGHGTFYNCHNLISVTIPDSVTSIEGNAFGNTQWIINKRKENPLVIVNGLLIDGQICSGDVVIPDTVTDICNFAFIDCSRITSITIPDSVKNIGNLSFAYCTALETISIPNSVKNIGYGAFRLCENLKSITILSLECNISEDSETFSNSYDYDNETDLYTGVFNCYADSTAETYAKKHDFNVEIIPFFLGDVTMDGIITGSDATRALQAYTLLSSDKDHGLTDIQFKAADVTSDGIITGSDATIILNYYTYLSSVKTDENTLSMVEWMKAQ